MNIFGFFAVLIACIAVVGSIWILCTKGFIITHNHKDLTEHTEEPKHPMGFSDENSETEKKPNEQKESKPAPMDRIIQAANELMGIDPEEENDE